MKIEFGTKLKLPDGTLLRVIHADYVNELSGSLPILVHYLETCSRIEEGTISKQDGANIKLKGWQDWLPFEVINEVRFSEFWNFISPIIENLGWYWEISDEKIVISDKPLKNK